MLFIYYKKCYYFLWTYVIVYYDQYDKINSHIYIFNLLRICKIRIVWRNNIFISFEFAIAYYFMWRNIYSPDVTGVSHLMEFCQLKLTICTVRTCNEKDCTNGTNEYTIQQYDVPLFWSVNLKARLIERSIILLIIRLQIAYRKLKIF